jgi:hypothetical protein
MPQRGQSSISITLPVGPLTTDSVKLTVSNGGNSVITTKAGPAGSDDHRHRPERRGTGDGTLTLAPTDRSRRERRDDDERDRDSDTVAPAATTAAYTTTALM